MARRSPIGHTGRPHKWQGKRWRSTVVVGYDSDGKVVRRWVYGKTRKECQAKADELRDQVRKGFDVADDSTLAQFLDTWIRFKDTNVADSTLGGYQEELSKLPDSLLMMPLNDVRGHHIILALPKVAEASGARCAHMVHKHLSQAFGDAVDWNRIPENPIKGVKRPRYAPKEVQIWTRRDVELFTSGASHYQHFALFYFALLLGLRPGESTTLRWSDLKNSTLHVRRTATKGKMTEAGTRGGYVVGPPKSEKGNRYLQVPSDGLALLEQHREKLRLAGVDSPWMFPTGDGGMLDPTNADKSFKRYCKASGAKEITRHGLRHTYAAMEITRGTNVVELAELLGHAKPSTTVNRYGHIFRQLEAQKRQPPTLAELKGGLDKLR